MVLTGLQISALAVETSQRRFVSVLSLRMGGILPLYDPRDFLSNVIFRYQIIIVRYQWDGFRSFISAVQGLSAQIIRWLRPFAAVSYQQKQTINDYLRRGYNTSPVKPDRVLA
jgi:hypothetical protein